jgi:hypothetical protein
VIKSIPSRLDVKLACTIEDGQGRPLGTVASVNTNGWQRVAQFLGGGIAASWEFDIVGADGTRLLNIRRPRVRDWRERFDVRDGGGRYIGRLIQNNSSQASIRTFSLESEQASLGCTTFEYKRIGGAFGKTATNTVTIHDSSGRPVAGITQRQAAARLAGNDFYDYMLTFAYSPYEPMGSLCLAVVVSEYFYRRIEHGGTLRTIPGV